MCSSFFNTTVDSSFYVWNQDYPNQIRDTDTSCSCSIEALSCSSQIRVRFVHLQLSDGGETCSEKKKIEIHDNEIVRTFTCSNNNDYEITEAMTSSANYLTIALDNPGGVEGGSFWIGFEGNLFIQVI